MLMANEQEQYIQAIGRLPKPIVLIGLMGAGKSTIGRRLARVIGRQFNDSDEEIEHAAACSIADIFALHGEQIFRDLEQRVINRLLDTSDLVLATGGGAWMQPAIRQQMQDKALTVWLKADLDTLVERVQRRDHRPLLQDGDKRQIMQRLMDERYPVYAQADITVHSADGPHEGVVQSTLQAIAEHVAS